MSAVGRKNCHVVVDVALFDKVVAGGTFVGEVRKALELWLLVRGGEVVVTRGGKEVEFL